MGGQPREENRVELASGLQRDCDQEQIDCFRKCWKRKPPYPRSYKKHDHLKYCEDKCRREYMECLRVTGQARLEFPTMTEAIEWLKRHPREVFVGSVVFVGGVALVVVVMAGGLLILAPI